MSGQAHINQISGNLYAQRNAQYPTIEMDMSSGFRNLDIFPIHPVAVDIASQDTSYNVEIHAPYTVEGMEWVYDQGRLLLLPSISLQALMDGKNGTTLSIPDVPDDGGFGDGDGSFPNPFPYPSLPSGTATAVRYWTGYNYATFKRISPD